MNLSTLEAPDKPNSGIPVFVSRTHLNFCWGGHAILFTTAIPTPRTRLSKYHLYLYGGKRLRQGGGRPAGRKSSRSRGGGEWGP